MRHFHEDGDVKHDRYWHQEGRYQDKRELDDQGIRRIERKHLKRRGAGQKASRDGYDKV